MLSVAVCGFTVSCSHQPAWRSTMTAARVWERRAGRAGRWWCALWGRVAQLSSRQCLGARGTARARTAARQRTKLSFFLHIVRETEDLWQVSEAEKYLKEQTDGARDFF